MVKDMTPFEIIDKQIDSGMYHPELEYPRSNDPQKREKFILYNAEKTEKENRFKNDLFTAYDLKNHPKAEKAFLIAWALGQPEGFYEILKIFNELTGLLSE